MGYEVLFIAIACFLILEGLLPFISPKFYKSLLLQMLEVDDNVVRLIGFTLIILGVIILNFI
jgi:hypothetical protein